MTTLQEKMGKDTKEKMYKLQKWSSESFLECKSTSPEPFGGSFGLLTNSVPQVSL